MPIATIVLFGLGTIALLVIFAFLRTIAQHEALEAELSKRILHYPFDVDRAKVMMQAIEDGEGFALIELHRELAIFIERVEGDRE